MSETETPTETPEKMPLPAVVRELEKIGGRIVISVHNVPIDYFAGENVKGVKAFSSYGRRWLSAHVTIDGEHYDLYSEDIFGSKSVVTPDDPNPDDEPF